MRLLLKLSTAVILAFAAQLALTADAAEVLDEARFVTRYQVGSLLGEAPDSPQVVAAADRWLQRRLDRHFSREAQASRLAVLHTARRQG